MNIFIEELNKISENSFGFSGGSEYIVCVAGYAKSVVKSEASGYIDKYYEVSNQQYHKSREFCEFCKRFGGRVEAEREKSYKAFLYSEGFFQRGRNTLLADRELGSKIYFTVLKVAKAVDSSATFSDFFENRDKAEEYFVQRGYQKAEVCEILQSKARLEFVKFLQILKSKQSRYKRTMGNRGGASGFGNTMASGASGAESFGCGAVGAESFGCGASGAESFGGSVNNSANMFGGGDSNWNIACGGAGINNLASKSCEHKIQQPTNQDSEYTRNIAMQGTIYDDCGSCQICVKACPMGAIPNNLERCMRAYMQEGRVKEEFSDALENRVLGCEICSGVCPKNAHVKIDLEEGIELSKLHDLVLKKDVSLTSKYGKNIISKNKLLPFILNAMGNSGHGEYFELVEKYLVAENENVRKSAEIAIEKLKNSNKKEIVEVEINE